MESLNKQLSVIKNKFPQQSGRIEELYEIDEDFRTLCSDYFLCMQYLQKFEKEFGEKQVTVDEYKIMRTELEKELYHFLSHK
jgi:hypothetical protein